MKAASSPFTEVGLTGHTGSKPSSDVMHVTGPTIALGTNIASTPDIGRFGIRFVGLTAIELAIVTLPLTWLSTLAIAVGSAWTFGVILGYLDRPGAPIGGPPAVTQLDKAGR